MAINIPQVEQYIRESARKRGIDPDIAVRVARSEGLAPGVWQSNVVKNGKRETSYGPFQLLVGGGLGDQFIKQTGMDPRDPSSVYQQVDFALDNAAQGGWGPWYGAAKVGVDKWDGLRGSTAKGVSPSMSPEELDFVRSNPQPGGFGPQIDAAMEPGASPPPPEGGGGGGGGMFDNIIPDAVAGHFESLDSEKKNPLKGFFQALANTPDAPTRRPGGLLGGDARASGDALMKVMQNPTIAKLLLAKRMGG